MTQRQKRELQNAILETRVIIQSTKNLIGLVKQIRDEYR